MVRLCGRPISNCTKLLRPVQSRDDSGEMALEWGLRSAPPPSHPSSQTRTRRRDKAVVTPRSQQHPHTFPLRVAPRPVGLYRGQHAGTLPNSSTLNPRIPGEARQRLTQATGLQLRLQQRPERRPSNRQLPPLPAADKDARARLRAAVAEPAAAAQRVARPG